MIFHCISLTSEYFLIVWKYCLPFGFNLLHSGFVSISDLAMRGSMLSLL